MIAPPRVPEKLVERLALLLRKLAGFARTKRAQGYRPEAHPYERNEGMTDRIEHPAHLPVTAFVQRQIDDRTFARHGDDAQLRRRSPLSVEGYSFAQSLYRLRFETATQRCAIDFINAESRMRQCVRQIAVVGEQQQSRGIVIEPTYRHQSRRLRAAATADELVCGSSSFGIAHGRHEAGGFVQHEHFALRHYDRTPVDRDAVVGFDLRAELAHDASVDANFSSQNQLLRRATRSDSGKCEIALQSHGESETRPLSQALPRA